MKNKAERYRNPRFRFREKELKLILGAWKGGKSVLLTGIRRTGKSELAKAALVRHADAGGDIGFLNVQGCASLYVFYRDLLREMPKDLLEEMAKLLITLKSLPDNLMTWFRSHVAKLEVLEQGVNFQPVEELPRYWETMVEALQEVLAKRDSVKLPVLCIDELPFMIENLVEAGVPDRELRLAMASLRNLREAGLRMIIAGSISMENLLALHKVPDTVLGGLSRIPVPPFSYEEAGDFLGERLEGAPAGTGTTIKLALETLPDYVPEFLEVAERHLLSTDDPVDFRDALERGAMTEIRRSFLTQFEERLVKNYNDDERQTAMEILDLVATGDPEGVRLEGRTLPINYPLVRRKLQYDNFILEADDYAWRFCLNLLREWWRADRGIS